MHTITIPTKDAQPGDVLHVMPHNPHRRHLITSLYLLDANTVVLHLEGLGAHKFDPTESITVDRVQHRPHNPGLSALQALTR